MSNSRKTDWLVCGAAAVATFVLLPQNVYADLAPIAQTNLPMPVAATPAAPSTYLTNILRAFIAAFKEQSRAAALGGGGLTAVFMGWAVSKAAAKMGLRAALSAYVWELATSFVFAIIAFNASPMATWFADGLAAAVSGGEHGGIMSNPSQLMTKAFEITTTLFTQGMQQPESDGFVDTVKSLGANALTAAERMPVIAAGVFVVIGFWWTAITGMAVVVYAHAKVLVGIMFAPFLVLPITRPVGMTGVGLIVSAAVELAVQSAIVGIGFKVLQGFTLDANSDFQAIFETALGACAVAFICSGASAAVAFAARVVKMF